MKQFIEAWTGLIIDPELIRSVAAKVKKEGSNEITITLTNYPNDTLTVHTLQDATVGQYQFLVDLLVKGKQSS